MDLMCFNAKRWSWMLLLSHLLFFASSSQHADVHSGRSRGFLERPRVSYSAQLHQRESRVKTSIDWSVQNRIPPWLSNIEAGFSQGVAVVLGQSLKPDGNPPQGLLDRALKAKELLTHSVSKIIVTGGDPAGVGHTEAYEMKQVLMKQGIPADVIIMESQATTTAENAWFSLRWIPKGTGHFYIVTSDFHIARATYIFEEVFNYFYRTWEERYKDDLRWKNPEKKYPRLELHQAAVASFCGSNQSAHDVDPHADINQYSLRKRALDELGFLGSGEVANALYGQPLDNNQIWPVQINVTLDPENEVNFNKALAQSMNTAKALCRCVSPPDSSEGAGAEIRYPLRLPASTNFPSDFPGPKDWEEIPRKCMT